MKHRQVKGDQRFSESHKATEIATKLYGRGLSDDDIAGLFEPRAYKGELRVRYDRGNGDLTAPLPSSRHEYYRAKIGSPSSSPKSHRP